MTVDRRRQSRAVSAEQRRARRRGSTYIMVLSVSIVLTVIGLSAVKISRLNARAVMRANHWRDAQLLASSAIEHALAKLNADSDWRNTYQGVTVEKSFVGGAFSWRVIDETDGDLTDDPSEPAKLVVNAGAGDAAYSLAVDLVGGSATPDNSLWGVDEDDGTLFSVADYNDRHDAVVTVYPRLKWLDGGSLRNVGADIESFTFDTDGTAYMVRNRDMGSCDKPVLLKFNVHGAVTSGDNVVEIVGHVNWADDITGVAIDAATQHLYALGKAGGPRTADHLLKIDKTTAAVTDDIGAMTGLHRRVGTGEDLEFDDSGNLYVVDDDSDDLYKVDKTSGAITQVVDNNMRSHSSFEALAWDSANQRMIASDTRLRNLYVITFRNGHNTYLDSYRSLGLTDIEGMGFIPPGGSQSAGAEVRPAATPSAVRRLVD
ncbi:MAG: hypothetical protein J7M14_03910 [Planctomycetes bacterium]|nr:hypothetical protein [Planctomycetota bacterium]